MGSDASCVISSDSPSSPSETPVFWSPSSKRFDTEHLVARFQDTPQISTIYELFEHTKAIAPDNNFYGMRAYENNTWKDHFNYVSRKNVAEMRDAIGSLLISRGLEFGSHIGILSYNRTEWIVIQHACYAYGYIPVPIYDTFGWENIRYILNHAELKYVFMVSSKFEDFIKNIKPNKVITTNLIIFDNEENPIDKNTLANIVKAKNNTNLNDNTNNNDDLNDIDNNDNNDNDNKEFIVEKYEDALKFPDRFPHRPPKPDTPASIMYTSGTTGNPKGVILTHSNFIAATASFYAYVYPFTHDDRYISYLPLAHVYEAVMHIIALKVIGTVVFYSGSIPRLLDEVKLFKPTVFTGVTRVYERIMSGIQGRISDQSFLKRFIFQTCFSMKSFSLRYLRLKKFPIVDKVFDSVQAALGGQLRLFVCGGASLSASQQHWMRIACRLQFIQGYGLTETTASTCVQLFSDCKDGNVGVLLPCAEAKLRDLPEQGFFAKDFSGELLVRGPSIFKGYYKDENATREVLDTNTGWFATGDVFQMNKTGQLNIISRCKELVKLSQGEYVAIPKLTEIYSTVKDVSQIYIHAGMESRFLTAIVVVSVNRRNQANNSDQMQIPSEKEMLQRFNEIATKEKLNGFERIKALKITTTQFSTDNGMCTPSLKLCRFKIAQVFKKELDEMENELRNC